MSNPTTHIRDEIVIGSEYGSGILKKSHDTRMSAFAISVQLFLQLAVILAVCRIVGRLAEAVGQPRVVGEMVAGVLMGPSVLGALAPAMQGALFPAETRPVLYALCQIGLVLYMFLVGVDFDSKLLRKHLRTAAAVSVSGIVCPFLLGAAAAWWLAPRWPLFAPETSVPEAMLFLGAAMSITAFPMLARIIRERGLTGTGVGTLSLASGSIDDAAAWCILAVVLASFAGSPSIALLAVGGGLAYALAVAFGVRPFLLRLARRVEARGEMGDGAMAIVLVLLMLGAWFTDFTGIYAVFGAFALGVAIPKGRLAEGLRESLEKLTVVFLLPLFFVYSGLNTKLNLLIAPELLGITLLLLVLAILGKGIACAAAARLSGREPREALAIGALMNARGLMELIILNIGLERGVITPTLFAMMVVMAVVTTLMATPIFQLVSRGAVFR